MMTFTSSGRSTVPLIRAPLDTGITFRAELGNCVRSSRLNARVSPKMIKSTVWIFWSSVQSVILVTPTLRAEIWISFGEIGCSSTSSGLSTCACGIFLSSVRMRLVLTVMSSRSFGDFTRKATGCGVGRAGDDGAAAGAAEGGAGALGAIVSWPKAAQGSAASSHATIHRGARRASRASFLIREFLAASSASWRP